jgi:hypothetical protein
MALEEAYTKQFKPYDEPAWISAELTNYKPVSALIEGYKQLWRHPHECWRRSKKELKLKPAVMIKGGNGALCIKANKAEQGVKMKLRRRPFIVERVRGLAGRAVSRPKRRQRQEASMDGATLFSRSA